MLVVNEAEAVQVRKLFQLYLRHRSVDDMDQAAVHAGIRSKRRVDADGMTTGGTKLGRGSLYAILSNPIHAGEIEHKGRRYPGQHTRIVPADLYDAVQRLLKANRRKARGTSSTGSGHTLSSLV